MPSRRLLLRQVLVSHGHATPPFPLGSLRQWLPALPSREATDAMDRSTVVLPRPGDGWYAPPAMSSTVGFPWGELSARGVEQMRLLGARIRKEAATRPDSWCLRAAGLVRCVAAAQALAWGALEAQRDRYAKPVEVLVAGGEALLPRMRPGDDGYPTLELGKPETEELEGLRAAPAAAAARLAAALSLPECSVAELDADSILRGALALEGLREERLDLASLRRLNYLTWAAPLREDSTKAMAVIGPLITEMLRAFDAAHHGSGEDLVVYVADASSLVCFECAMATASSMGGASWPEPGASLAAELYDSGGEVLFALRGRDGTFLPPGPTRYKELRERLGEAIATAEE